MYQMHVTIARVAGAEYLIQEWHTKILHHLSRKYGFYIVGFFFLTVTDV